MNKELENKIKSVYKECKSLLIQHEYSDVLSNEDFTCKEVWDEFARQINYTNKFLSKQKDLQFLLTLLTEAKNGITSGTPAGNVALSTIDKYISLINALLKSYSTVIIGQRWILDYYLRGGGLM